MQGFTQTSRFAVVAVVAGVLGLGGCGFGATSGSANPPPRASVPAGPAYSAAAKYLKAHPVRLPKGEDLIAGILVQSRSPGDACLNGWCETWHATVIVAGRRLERIVSDADCNGMASLVSPGDEFIFPSGGAVDAPSDDGDGWPAKLITAGAVATP